MMHEIVNADLHDKEYVAAHTVGFEQLGRTPAGMAAPACGPYNRHPGRTDPRTGRATMPATRPAAIRVNYGLQRHYGGGMAMRNITCLPALIGAWREQGGGIQLSVSGQLRHLEKSGLERPDLLAGRIPRTINMNRLGDALSLDRTRLAASHYAPRPVDRKPRARRCRPAGQGSDRLPTATPPPSRPTSHRSRPGLAREDLFTVVLEHFQTDTADYADYLLPATTQAEHWDLQRNVRPPFLSTQPASDPTGGRGASQQRHLPRPCPGPWAIPTAASTRTTRPSCATSSRRSAILSYETVTWEALLEKGFVRLNLPQPYLPFAEGNFPTPSGKCEFYSERMAQDGYDPLPTYTPPKSEERRDEE